MMIMPCHSYVIRMSFVCHNILWADICDIFMVKSITQLYNIINYIYYIVAINVV